MRSSIRSYRQVEPFHPCSEICWRSDIAGKFYFDVPVQNFEIVKFFEPSKGVDDDIPDEILIEVLSFLFVLRNLVVEVSIVCELHDNARCRQIYHRLLPSRKASL